MPYFYENISNSFTKLKSVIVRKDENASFFRNPINYMILGGVLLVLIFAYFLNMFGIFKFIITKFKVYHSKKYIQHLDKLIQKDTKKISDGILLAKNNNQMKYKMFSDVIIARDSIKEMIIEVNKNIEFIHEHGKFTDKDILLIQNVKESISNANNEFESLNLFVIEHKNIIEITMIDAKLRITNMCTNLDNLVEKLSSCIRKFKATRCFGKDERSDSISEIKRLIKEVTIGIKTTTKHINIIDEVRELMPSYEETKMMMQASINKAQEKLNEPLPF